MRVMKSTWDYTLQPWMWIKEYWEILCNSLYQWKSYGNGHNILNHQFHQHFPTEKKLYFWFVYFLIIRCISLHFALIRSYFCKIFYITEAQRLNSLQKTCFKFWNKYGKWQTGIAEKYTQQKCLWLSDRWTAWKQ